ncbi:hypothetical protein Tco_1157526 [Tanacetum coccineum]
MQTVVGDGVAGIKRRRRDLSSDGVRNLATASGRGRLKEDLELNLKCDPKINLEVLRTLFNKFFDSEEVNASDRENRFLQKYFKDITREDLQTFRTQESLVIESIVLEDNLVAKESTDDSVSSSEQLDESSSLGNDADAKNILVEMVASGIENDDVRPSYDSDPMSEVHHDIFEIVFAHRIQNHEQPESIPYTYVVNENNSDIIFDTPNMDSVRD